MIKFSKKFKEFLNEKSIKEFSYNDIENFNQFLLNNDHEVKFRVEENLKHEEEVNNILLSNLNYNEKYKRLLELSENNPHDINYQRGLFMLTKDLESAIKFFYEEISYMYNGEFENLIGFFSNFVLTEEIVDFGMNILFEAKIKGDYQTSEKICKTIIVLNQNDKYHVGNELLMIYFVLGKYNELIDLYMKIKSPSIDQHLIVFLMYLKNHQIDYALSLLEIINKENQYLIPCVFSLLPESFLKEDKYQKSLEIIKNLDWYISLEDRMNLISSLSNEEIEDLFFSYFNLNIDEISLIKIIEENNSKIVKDQLINDYKDEFKDDISLLIDKLVRKEYLIEKEQNIFISSLGKMCYLSYFNDEEDNILIN